MTAGADAGAVLTLPYAEPYAWERILGFLALRAIPGVEAVDDGAYWRTVQVDAPSGEGVLRGWLSVRPDKERAQAMLTVSSSLQDVASVCAEHVRHLFDLDADPVAIGAGLASFRDRFPGKLIPGTRLPGCFDAFEMCTRAVLGQQISVKGASTLLAIQAAAPV